MPDLIAHSHKAPSGARRPFLLWGLALVSATLTLSSLAAAGAAQPVRPAPLVKAGRAELERARLLPEPLAPMAREPSPAENDALARALEDYGIAKSSTVLEAFQKAHPASPWTPALLVNLGLLRFDEGFFSVALEHWTRAWQLSRNAQGLSPAAEALRIRGVAEAIKMNCRIGRVSDAKALLAELGRPAARGRNAAMLEESRHAIAQMETMPADAFKCGPYALSSILFHQRAHTPETQRCIASYPTTAQGTSLAQVASLSAKLGLRMQPARRTSPTADLPLPAVVNWKVHHYGALLEKRGERYLLNDPTFGTAQWIRAEALVSEPSGYFLLPAGPLPQGWVAVDAAEAATVWGRGNCATGDGSGAGPNAPQAPGCGGGRGMAVWSINLCLASLNVRDIPIAYQPPVGPGVSFALNYSAVEQNQPTLIDYSHLGPLWNFSLLSYVTVENEGDGNARIHAGAGGMETYYALKDPGDYTPDQQSGARMFRVSPTHFERRSGDGAKLVFNLPDPSGRLFLTQVVDPQGNALVLGYDAHFRLVSVTDAIGQVSTLTHGSNTPGDPQFYLVTRFTDPFGRFASITYTDGQLTQITDQIGLTSQFAYTDGFITQMTTPYGVTQFDGALTVDPVRGNVVHLEVTEPNGAKQRVESVQDQPTEPGESQVPAGMPVLNGFLNYRNSYYWDRKAMADAPGDYSRARLTHFLHHNGGAVKSNVAESRREPLEGRVWFEYQDNPISGFSVPGMRANPTHIGRVLDDGSTQLERFVYNDWGNLTQSVDPVGRTTNYVYAANGLDLLQASQLNAQGGQDRLLTLTWNAQHRPLTVTDASGATTTFTYNARGQTLTATNARGETVTLSYNPQGYLVAVDGPLPGSMDRTVYTYDGFGRRSSATSPDGYMLSYTYDAFDRLTRVTYPDGSYEQVTYTHLDRTQVRDRLGNVTSFTYNALRQLTSITEPLSRVTTFEWCRCGGLERMIDPLNRTTEWTRDLQGRTIAKTTADGHSERIVYEGRTSRVFATTDARGQTTAFLYHADDSLAGRYYPGAGTTTPSVSFGYDRAYPRLTSMSDGTGLTTYSYGPVSAGLAPGANQLVEVRNAWSKSTTTYAYDELGRRTTRSIDGFAETTIFDAAGRTALVNNPLGSFDYTYEAGTNRVTRIGYPNGVSSTATYFGHAGDHRMQQVQHWRAGNVPLSRFSYTYDGGGRISTWAQQSDNAPETTYAFTYDAVSQLTAASAPGRSYAYSYDKAANQLTRTLNAVTSSLTYNAVNELQHVTQAQGADRSYTWDAANRLIRIDYTGSNLHTRFVYDGLGRCVEIAEWNGATLNSARRFVWCGVERCEERDANGSVTRRFFRQGEQVAGSNFYYTRDHLGSVREMLDVSGTIRARYEYDPFGQRTRVAGDLEATMGFTGHYFHAASGLHLTRFRSYDAASSRWLSRDPLGEAGGPNGYAYALNNPVNAIDPMGLVQWSGVGVAAVGIAGNGLAFVAGGTVAAAGIPLLAPPTGVTQIIGGALIAGGGAVAINAGYGLAANTANLVAAVGDVEGPSKGSLPTDVAHHYYPDNHGLQLVAGGADLLLGLISGPFATSANFLRAGKLAKGLDDAAAVTGLGTAAFGGGGEVAAATGAGQGGGASGGGGSRPGGPGGPGGGGIGGPGGPGAAGAGGAGSFGGPGVGSNGPGAGGASGGAGGTRGPGAGGAGGPGSPGGAAGPTGSGGGGSCRAL